MPANPGAFIPPVRVVGILPAPASALPPLLVQAAFFIVLLAAASIIDCRKRIIPNTICVLTAAAGLISFSPARLLGPLAALPLLAAAMGQPGGMGGGDIKFTAAAGLVLGFWNCLWGLALGLALAVLFHGARALILRLRGERAQPIHRAALPLAPFLSTGFATLYCLNVGGI